jgi:hypothetical protein
METTYDERAVILAYIDAQRPPYPHEDFKRFRQARLNALESHLKIRISPEGANSANRVLWLLFAGTANSYLGISSSTSVLEGGLLETVLDREDTPDLGLREHQNRIYRHLEEAKSAHLDLLVGLFRLLWGSITNPITSSDLMKLGFDDASEPKPHDYYDLM